MDRGSGRPGCRAVFGEDGDRHHREEADVADGLEGEEEGAGGQQDVGHTRPPAEQPHQDQEGRDHLNQPGQHVVEVRRLPLGDQLGEDRVAHRLRDVPVDARPRRVDQGQGGGGHRCDQQGSAADARVHGGGAEDRPEKDQDRRAGNQAEEHRGGGGAHADHGQREPPRDRRRPVSRGAMDDEGEGQHPEPGDEAGMEVGPEQVHRGQQPDHPSVAVPPALDD